MPKFIRFIFMALFGLVVIVFLVSNRQDVIIGMDPFAPDTPAIATGPIPLWFALAAAMFAGYLLGALGMWASGKGTRKKARERKREIKQMKKDADTTAKANAENLPAVQ